MVFPFSCCSCCSSVMRKRVAVVVLSEDLGGAECESCVGILSDQVINLRKFNDDGVRPAAYYVTYVMAPLSSYSILTAYSYTILSLS